MVKISSRPAILRKLGSEIRTLKGQHRLNQQRRFLATQKSLQLKQFRANQKLQLVRQRQQISSAKQQIQRIRQIKQAKTAAKFRKVSRGVKSVFGSFR